MASGDERIEAIFECKEILRAGAALRAGLFIESLPIVARALFPGRKIDAESLNAAAKWLRFVKAAPKARNRHALQ